MGLAQTLGTESMPNHDDPSRHPARPRDPPSGERRITLGELTSCTDGKLVVAECDDTGRPRHIDDVDNGLKCRCVCPGCRRKMVAHQGERRRHFQHAAEGVDCSSAGESALHRFAKDVLAKALKLRLPELTARHGNESLPVVTEQEFAFDSAVLEQRTDDVIPDVVCRKGGRALHVEFMVTHACGPEKIEKLRAMDIGTIEIDLSGYRDVPLEELDHAILAEASRTWLHNPRLAMVEARLEENERIRLAAEEERAASLLKGLKPVLKGSVGEFEHLALAAGLAGLLDDDGDDIGFVVSGREWRAFVLMRYAVSGSGFDHRDVFEEMKRRGWIAQGFAYVGKAGAAAIQRVTGRNTLPPWQSLWGFLAKLERTGFLNQTSGANDYLAGRKLREWTEPWRQELQKPQRRKDEFKALFEAIVARIRTEGLKEGLTFDGWFVSDVGRGIVPADTIAEDDAFTNLSGRLQVLLRGMSGYPARADEPLGFPVVEDLEIRAEARRRVDEEREAERKSRSLQEAVDREKRLYLRAARLLEPGDVRDWMEGPSSSLSSKSPREAARMSEPGYVTASDALDRHRSAADRQVASREAAARWVEKLRREARTAFRDVSRADLWVRSSTHRLGGKRPDEHCVDEATYRECSALLTEATRRRR